MAVHHHLLDLVVGEQLLERAEADGVAEDQLGDLPAALGREDPRRLLDQGADRRLEPRRRLAGERLGVAALDQAQPKLGGERAGVVLCGGDALRRRERRRSLPPRAYARGVSATDVLLVAAVLLGMSLQAAVGFGFALIVAPAAYASFPAGEAVTLVILLAIAINCLVLFTERRPRAIAAGPARNVLLAALPGMVLGALVLERVDHEALQIALGVVVLAGAGVQAAVRGVPRPRRSAPLELGAGGIAGVLTTSVSVNGPVLVLAFGALGLRGSAFRDSLAVVLLGLSVPALAIVFAVVGVSAAMPDGGLLLACVPALLVGHRFGAAIFRRLDDATHHRIVLIAAATAGLLSIVVAVA